MVGSTECDLIWREKVTPAKHSIFRLSPLTRRISAAASTGSQAPWITPTTRDWKDTPGMATTGPDGRVRLDQLPQQVAATWPTATAADARMSGALGYGGQAFMTLTDAANVTAATWPTPTAVNRERDEATMAKCAAFRKRNANQNTVPLYLPEVVRQTAVWPTPTTNQFEVKDTQELLARRQRTQEKHGNGNGFGLTLSQMASIDATAHSGPTPSGSQAQTEKRGALNPAFPCWLMGYPEEWLWCAPAQPGRKKRTSTAASEP